MKLKKKKKFNDFEYSSIQLDEYVSIGEYLNSLFYIETTYVNR
jgi:hypothetical protein